MSNSKNKRITFVFPQEHKGVHSVPKKPKRTKPKRIAVSPKDTKVFPEEKQGATKLSECLKQQQQFLDKYLALTPEGRKIANATMAPFHFKDELGYNLKYSTKNIISEQQNKTYDTRSICKEINDILCHQENDLSKLKKNYLKFNEDMNEYGLEVTKNKHKIQFLLLELRKKSICDLTPRTSVANDLNRLSVAKGKEESVSNYDYNLNLNGDALKKNRYV